MSLWLPRHPTWDADSEEEEEQKEPKASRGRSGSRDETGQTRMGLDGTERRRTGRWSRSTAQSEHSPLEGTKEARPEVEAWRVVRKKSRTKSNMLGEMAFISRRCEIKRDLRSFRATVPEGLNIANDGGWEEVTMY